MNHPAGQIQAAVTNALTGRCATTREIHAAVSAAGFGAIGGGELLLSEVEALLSRMEQLGRVVGLDVAGEMLWSKPPPVPA